MAATRYWSVEECRWVDAPAATPVRVPEQQEQPARLGDDEMSSLPRQRGMDELRERTWEGVEG